MSAAKRRLRRESKSSNVGDFSQYPAHQPCNIGEFLPYHEYQYQSKTVSVCHVIESVGLGGAQTMMMELVNGLNNYFGDHIVNHVIYLGYKKQNINKKLYKSYGVIPKHVTHSELKNFCEKHHVDIVVQHRIAHSKCIKKHLPPNVKYILLNHTWNFLYRMKEFLYCDFYISVCNFLKNKTSWPDFIHPSRRLVILNGVENNYVAELSPKVLRGSFKTGRCHRLVPSKFDVTSIRWMNTKVAKAIPGFKHYLMGTSQAAKQSTQSGSAVEYMGSIYDRNEKMSIIKGLDVYYYETSQHEGASVAILESLACGVPVICGIFGGNGELVHHRINGYIVSDRSGYLEIMKFLSSNKEQLEEIKLKVRMDFENRLHIKHTACKYMQLFEYFDGT